jgi:hypothetical protein
MAEAEVGQIRRLARSSGRSSRSCSTGTDDGDACGCHDLVGGIIEEIVLRRFRGYALEGNLRSSGSGDGGVVCVFLSLGGIISESTSA